MAAGMEIKLHHIHLIEEHSVSGQSDVVLETIYVVYGMYMEVMWQDKDVNVMVHYGQGSLIVEVRKKNDEEVVCMWTFIMLC